ncbi:pentatricopeptide repeat-containing protein At3g58590 [Neltuma alba]|uniref:pentatricopeptide repeat-containing protein At3g58590 n=1 Tax=Neltuma alba TaxID=207710 RepID=UPI0010A2C387|nr:pentatricopeptide repeat-containing protein At3g58590 [Prosopis alba]
MSSCEELLRHGQRLRRLLNACSSIRSLKETKSLHALTVTMGPIPNQSAFINNNIMSGYLSFGQPVLARKLFDSLPQKTVVSYNTLIVEYGRSGDVIEAWDLFCEMRRHVLRPTQYTLSGLLLCESLNLAQGVQLHAFSIKNGLFCADAFVGTNLLGFFGRHGCLDEVFSVFEDIPRKSLVTWNSMLSVLAHNGTVEDCLLMFRDLVRMGVSLSEYSFGSVLSALGSKQSLKYGELLHGLMTKCGFDCQVSAASSLIRMYVNCKGIVLAEKLFEQMPIQNVVSWNIIIDAWAKSERPQMALKLFSNMSSRGLMPSQATFVVVINSCTNLKIPVYGDFIHAKVIKNGFKSDVIVGTALVDFYAKCGELEYAHNSFHDLEDKNLVSWNALILGYSNKCSSASVILLQQMLQLGYRPNEFSFSAVLKSSLASDLHQLHCLIIRMGYENYDYVLSSLLMSYTRNGLINEAMAFVKDLNNPLPVVPSNVIAGIYNRTRQYNETLKFLSLLEKPDVVSWNIVIAACARSNYYHDVFELFKHMRSADIHPDNYSFTSLLCVSTKLCSLALGSSLHGLILKTDINNGDTFLSNLLIDMYGKCGSIDSSVKIFGEIEDRNLITWTALITALGLNGYPHEALTRFREMEMTGLKPDALTLRAVLSACRYGGLVSEGMEFFRKMTMIYGIQPEIDHYHQIVDLLAKNGCIVEAEKVIASMPFPPNANIWRSFLEGYKRQETANRLV